jgi:hypothetical protein
MESRNDGQECFNFEARVVNEGPGTLNEMLDENCDVNKKFRITVTGNDKNEIQFDKYVAHDANSADQHLLNDEYYKTQYVPKHTPTDLGLTTTGNPVFTSDSRDTVATSRNWINSCEGKRTNDEAYMSKPSDNPVTPRV